MAVAFYVCPPTLLPASLVVIVFMLAACQGQLLLSVPRTHIAAAADGVSVTYFAGGQLYVRSSSCCILSITVVPHGPSELTKPSKGGGIATDVVDYIEWAVQPLAVRQLPPMRNLRREAAAVFAAGNLVVGGGMYA